MRGSVLLQYIGVSAFIFQALMSIRVFKSSRLKTAAILSLFFVGLGLLTLPLDHMISVFGIGIDTRVVLQITATVTVYFAALMTLYLLVKKSILQLLLAFMNFVFAAFIIVSVLQDSGNSASWALPIFAQSILAAGALIWQIHHFKSKQFIPTLRLMLMSCIVGVASVMFADLLIRPIAGAGGWAALTLVSSCMGILLLVLSINWRKDDSLPENTVA